MKPYTVKNKITEEAYNTIRNCESIYFADDEWDTVAYAISHAVDRAFDAGKREQKKTPNDVRKFMKMKDSDDNE